NKTSIFILMNLSNLLLLWEEEGHERPPGPTPLPILGNFLQLDRKNLVQSLMEVSWYGPVFTVFLGLQRVVVLCGYQAVKEALVDQAEEFSGRGQLPAFSKDFNHHGIVFANGQRWQQLRRFSLTTLRNFGMGKRSIEERIQEEAQCLVEELRKAEGTPFDPTFLLNHTVSNVICSIVFGKRFEYSDEKFLRLNKLITERFCVASSTEIMEKIPGVHHAGHRCSQQIIGFIKERIQMQQASLDPHLEKHNPDSEFCMENLVMATFNLFFAGTETISTTLRFGFLILMKHPQVQGQGGRMIGAGRCPSADDRRQMPYMEAVLHEIQRFSDILPMSLPHALTQDTHFRGYAIPKGTYIYPLLSTVHYDAEHHASPEQFEPRRFLDSHSRFKMADAFMPFSAGKRLCLGEGLAFTLTSLVLLGEVSIVPNASGVSRVPMRYQLLVVPRQA
uniref:Uncharacterized protein n=1 Tax=Laticauda laticaudata TaxID=8630 RepID=A0A8C5SK27_LATLA